MLLLGCFEGRQSVHFEFGGVNTNKCVLSRNVAIYDDLNNRTLDLPMDRKMKFLLSWENAALKSEPTIQCQVGPYLVSNRRCGQETQKPVSI
jgi:hypothetical protein